MWASSRAWGCRDVARQGILSVVSLVRTPRLGSHQSPVAGTPAADPTLRPRIRPPSPGVGMALVGSRLVIASLDDGAGAGAGGRKMEILKLKI